MKIDEVVLSPEKVAEIEKYNKSSGNAWIKYVLGQAKVDKYIQDTLERVPEKSKYGTPYNCYHVGHVVYKRKDGQPITQDDLDIVGLCVSGQSNIVRGNVGDETLTYDWVCDSGD